MKYKFSKKLEEVVIIQPDIFYDYRGEYIETWNVENYKIFDHLVNNNKPIIFKQDDISTSVKHTLWNDPKLNIPWPIDNPLLSSRDKNADTI